MRRRPTLPQTVDRDLVELPPEVRWREWMGRVEAVIFAASEPVDRGALALLIGEAANLDDLIADIRAELVNRPYELIAVASGWQHRTRPKFATSIRAARGIGDLGDVSISQSDALLLMMIGVFQPVTRGELSRLLGRNVSRDQIGRLRNHDLIAAGPRSPEPGAPYTYVTTKEFLSLFGMESLADLPDLEQLEDAGLLRQDGIDIGLPGEETGAGEDE